MGFLFVTLVQGTRAITEDSQLKSLLDPVINALKENIPDLAAAKKMDKPIILLTNKVPLKALIDYCKKCLMKEIPL